MFASESECVLAASTRALSVRARGARRRLREALVASALACRRGRVPGFFDDEPGWGRLLVCGTPLVGTADALRCQQRVMGTLCGLLEDGTAHVEGELSLDPMLTCELTVGGVMAVIRARMLTGGASPFVELAPALMSFIVRPYLGQAAAQAELTGRPAREESAPPPMLRSARRTARSKCCARSPPHRVPATVASQTSRAWWMKARPRSCSRGWPSAA